MHVKCLYKNKFLSNMFFKLFGDVVIPALIKRNAVH